MATQIQPFEKESAFEEALCNLLEQHGWTSGVISHPTEDDLIQNWADILFDLNRGREALGNYPLTASEMRQIIDQVNMAGCPYNINKLINGKRVCIKRDNPADVENFGKEVYLKIFDPKEIRAGQSRYQIVRQPKFKTAHALAGDRRGDVMLLINGMPVIHVELKRSRVDVTQAVFQIKRYMHEGVFSHGIFSMVQIFVAMTPEKTLYFANPGTEDRFQKEFQFHWADFNNNEILAWNRVAAELINIPMAHQLIGYYTIADDKDQALKVLRSYQYYAASKICDITHQTNWDDHEHRGGYIWHTTGSGKTMTSFKSAQLIANSNDADKVVFLMDRIELGIQSLDEYRGFAGEDDTIQDTQNTQILVSKLDSNNLDERLIVTSLQKMANVTPSALIPAEVIERIGKKRLVFIIDECHRSVFGEMLMTIKRTFPRALLFGFTGTPVFEENAHNEITTSTIFGDMLHKYTIANGIPDGNVLGFDPYRVADERNEADIRQLAAFCRLKVHGMDEIEGDEEAMRVYDQFMNELPMMSDYTENGDTKHGIEYYLPKWFYRSDEHHQAVAANIMGKFDRMSKNYKFHAILATKNIPEAIEYYRIFKTQYSSLNVVSVFDNSIDNNDEGIAREDAILEMLEDYNTKYNTSFALPNYAQYKKDVAKRLAHKKPYNGIEHDHTKQIDLLIVVTQMLTGYDSKWVNTLYVDKVMKYVDVIQAFSRTNRLFGPDKPFGNIFYYSYPYTMEQNINEALEVYVDRPLGVFVDKLEDNLMNINRKFLHIRDIFFSHELFNFERLPDTAEDRRMFAKDFSSMTRMLEAAKFQGFVWEQAEYEFRHDETYTHVKMELDENTYLILLQRYRELFEGGEGTDNPFVIDYPIDVYITETGTGTIDAEYINSKFNRFIKQLYTDGPGSEPTKAALRELHKTFASLPQKDQRTAILILHDIQCGDLHPEAGKSIQDYINAYQLRELHKQAVILSEATGVNLGNLERLMLANPTEDNIDDFSRFTELRMTLDLQKTQVFLTKVEGVEQKMRVVLAKGAKYLKSFVLDPDMRERILQAYLTDGVTLDTAVVEHGNVEEGFKDLEEGQESQGKLGADIIKANLVELANNTLAGVKQGMRPMKQVANAVFYVMEAKTIPSLDGVGMFLQSAFNSLYKEGANIVDKFVAYNLLSTKFEAYLKKLYYMMNNEEVPPRNPGEDVTWSNVIHGIEPLWQLKYSQDEAKQQLYQWLLIVKEWRNDESHLSPTASEKEVDAAINIILTMYCYATGWCITDLECNGCEIEEDAPVVRMYTQKEEGKGLMAAEDNSLK